MSHTGVAAALMLALGSERSDSASLRVAVDSAAHEVRVEYRTGPSAAADVAAHPAHAHANAHAAGGGAGHAGHVQRVIHFIWPVRGWVRGVRVELESPTGAMLPRRALHHVNLLNFDRRQLVHPALERLYAAGPETEPIMLPRTVGIPVESGTRLALLAAFDPAELAPGSLVRLRIKWIPERTVPRPMDVFPVLIDVAFRPGSSPAYHLPAGRSERSFDFELPLSGRALGVGGHLHDFGEALRLEDLATGRIVFDLAATVDSTGRLISMPLSLFGVTGRGRALASGRRYRLTAVYNNRGSQPLSGGAMAELVLLFAPDRVGDWPRLDPRHPAILADLDGLAGTGTD